MKGYNMNNKTNHFIHPSQPIYGKNVVATSQYLAGQAGLFALKEGGNAVDAALTAAITLTVVEPCSNGLGSDAFAIIWDGKELHGINGSGKSPKEWSLKRFKNLNSMPQWGWDSVTIPGAVDTWVKLSKRFGRLPFKKLFTPAIHYAANGFPLSHHVAEAFLRAKELYKNFKTFQDTFFPHGRIPQCGEIITLPHHAKTLQIIADSNGEEFYRGRLAKLMVNDSFINGGLLTLEDLAEMDSFWVTPFASPYHDIMVHEIPPNGQGMAALMALGILENFQLKKSVVNSPQSIHLQVEAMKCAFAEINAHLADLDHMAMKPANLLDKGQLKKYAAMIDLEIAQYPQAMISLEQGTVYLTTADESGMMVSFIQSNFWGFGSGVVIPETGIAMQNRGFGFNLISGHPNQVDGGKRPFHTIIPGFVTKNNKPLLSFGVMGGHMQAQGHLQMITRIFDYGQNIQEASNEPRWYVDRDNTLFLEDGFTKEVVDELKKRKHLTKQIKESGLFGGAQLIMRMDNGYYMAASDHRKDGSALAY